MQPFLFRVFRTVGLAVSLLVYSVQAQVVYDSTGQDILAHLYDGLDDNDVSALALVERLTALLEHPLDLNTASAAELAQLPAISYDQAIRIILFRKQYGPFSTLVELRAVEGISQHDFHMTRPFVAIQDTHEQLPSSPVSEESLRDRWSMKVYQRMTRRYDAQPALHAPHRIYTRIQGHKKQFIRFNLTLEKDPGESFRWSPQNHTYGFDHVTFHLALNNLGRIRNVVFGDYTLNVGQGILLWQPNALGKQSETVRTPIRYGSGVAPYGSTEENRFFRGISTTIDLSSWLTITPFLSRRSLDATPQYADSSRSIQALSTLTQSGLHRTASELERKDIVRSEVYGSIISLQHGPLSWSILGYQTRFQYPFVPGEQVHSRFSFSGTHATLYSTSAHLTLRNAHFFGELALDAGRHLGSLGGIKIDASRRLQASFLIRSFSPEFVSLHGNTFGERSGTPTNEQGLYAGVSLQLTPTWLLNAYVDAYRFPWARTDASFPSTGHDVLIRLERRTNKRLLTYVQLKTERRESDVKPGGLIESRPLGLEQESVQSMRFHLRYLLHRTVQMQSRLEMKQHASSNGERTTGNLLYQDLRIMPGKRLQMDVRYALFRADAFSSRLFAYEYDLRNTFAIPAFHGRGRRVYFLFRFVLLDSVRIELKLAETVWYDRQSTTFLDPGRLREVRAQLYWTY